MDNNNENMEPIISNNDRSNHKNSLNISEQNITPKKFSPTFFLNENVNEKDQPLLVTVRRVKRATSFHGGAKLNRGGSLPRLEVTTESQRKSDSLINQFLETGSKTNEFETPKRKRSQSMDDLFKHSWDYMPFFWNEKAWKEKLERKSNIEDSVIPTTIPENLEQKQTPAQIRSILVGNLRNVDTLIGENSPERKKTTEKKKVRQVRFTDNTLDNEIKKIETDLRVFDEIPYVERNGTEDDDEKKGLLKFEMEGNNAEGSPRKLIAAGVLEKLVSRLADQRLPDQSFIKEFFYTYRNIIAPIKLLTMLIERFDFNLPPNPTESDLEYYNHYQTVVKLRVVNVIKKWLTNHYYDFMEENRLFNKLKNFIDEKIVKHLDNRWALQLRVIIQEKHPTPFPLTSDSPLEMIEVTAKRPDSGILFSTYTQKKTVYNMCFWGFQLQNWMVAVIETKPEEAADIIERMINASIIFPIDHKEKKFKKSSIYRFINRLGEIPTDPIAPENISGKPLKFLDIHPLEIARQLSLITHNVFLKINARELTELMRSECIIKSYKVPWIDRLYKRLREVAFWVASEIVLCANASQRLTVMKRFLEVSEYCYKFQNFCDLSAIIGGLRLPAINRLTKTWKSLSKKKHYKVYQDLLSSLKTDTIREKIRKAVPPVIPIFDLYLKELTEIQKMPDTLENGMINWSKLRQQAILYEEIERTRNGSPYSYKPVPIYQNFLTLDCVILSEHDLLYYSHECEPDSDLV